MPPVVQGEIWNAVFREESQGHEQHGIRPVVIISSTRFNMLPGELCVVVPVTRTQRGFRLHVELTPESTGLPYPSVAMCDQVRSISTGRLRKRVGMVPADILQVIRQQIRWILG